MDGISKEVKTCLTLLKDNLNLLFFLNLTISTRNSFEFKFRIFKYFIFSLLSDIIGTILHKLTNFILIHLSHSFSGTNNLSQRRRINLFLPCNNGLTGFLQASSCIRWRTSFTYFYSFLRFFRPPIKVN